MKKTCCFYIHTTVCFPIKSTGRGIRIGTQKLDGHEYHVV